MDLTQPNIHWLWNRPNGYKYGHSFADIVNINKWTVSTIALGFNSYVDKNHVWSIFTMYWPQIAFYALIGRD